MGDLDANILADTARRYSGLRRRYWRFMLGFLALCGVSGLSSLLEESAPLLHPVIDCIMLGAVIPGVLTCGIGAFVTECSLSRFRCPRCGERCNIAGWAIMGWYWCTHCGLDLGPAAIATAKAKPSPGVDSWE